MVHSPPSSLPSPCLPKAFAPSPLDLPNTPLCPQTSLLSTTLTHLSTKLAHLSTTLTHLSTTLTRLSTTLTYLSTTPEYHVAHSTIGLAFICAVCLGAGERPTLKDWENHLSTIFPEIRLKKFIEMRGADGGPWKIICALSALWVGLLYDSQSQAAALDLIKDWTREDHEQLRAEVLTTVLA